MSDEKTIPLCVGTECENCWEESECEGGRLFCRRMEPLVRREDQPTGRLMVWHPTDRGWVCVPDLMADATAAEAECERLRARVRELESDRDRYRAWYEEQKSASAAWKVECEKWAERMREMEVERAATDEDVDAEPDVHDIVMEYLERHGFDGLHNPDGECGCELDDLAPCGELSARCCAGYKFPCDCGDHDFHIGTAEARDHYFAEHADGAAQAAKETEGRE